MNKGRFQIPSQPRTFWLGLACVLLAVIVGATWLVHRFSVAQTLSLSRAETTALKEQQPNLSASPTHIFIENQINVNVESFHLAEGKEWVVSDTQATYLADSARPGQAGNIILYGHNKRSIFGNLRNLKGGEEIVLTTEDGVEHRYKVILIKEVSPSNTTFLLPTRQETLTVYTCTGFFDTRRFIVRAVPQ